MMTSHSSQVYPGNEKKPIASSLPNFMKTVAHRRFPKTTPEICVRAFYHMQYDAGLQRNHGLLIKVCVIIERNFGCLDIFAKYQFIILTGELLTPFYHILPVDCLY